MLGNVHTPSLLLYANLAVSAVYRNDIYSFSWSFYTQRWCCNVVTSYYLSAKSGEQNLTCIGRKVTNYPTIVGCIDAQLTLGADFGDSVLLTTRAITDIRNQPTLICCNLCTAHFNCSGDIVE